MSEHARALGGRAWSAYASPDPFASAPLAERESTPLPFVRDAFRCHLGRFPSVANGLNELEAAALAALRRGPRRFGELFQEVTARPHLRRHGMGDVQFAACLRGLMPLVNITGGDTLTAEIDITAPGREVEAGEADWLALHPIDTWLGGVHLHHGGPLWRWDGARGASGDRSGVRTGDRSGGRILQWRVGEGWVIAGHGNVTGGKSGLHRAGCWVTPTGRKARESATEKRPPIARSVRVKR